MPETSAGANETIVAVVIISFVGVLSIVIARKTSGEDMLKALGIVGTLYGSIIAGIGTYFFTRPALHEAQEGRKDAVLRAEAAVEAVSAFENLVESVAEVWPDLERSLSSLNDAQKVEAHRVLLKNPAQFQSAFIGRLPPSDQAKLKRDSVNEVLERVKPDIIKLEATRMSLRKPR